MWIHMNDGNRIGSFSLPFGESYRKRALELRLATALTLAASFDPCLTRSKLISTEFDSQSPYCSARARSELTPVLGGWCRATTASLSGFPTSYSLENSKCGWRDWYLPGFRG